MPEQPLFDLMQPAENKDVQYSHLCTQIDNILNSYDDEFDAFSELIQNSVDSLFEKCAEGADDFVPKIDIYLDYKHNRLTVLDNGIGVDPQDFPSAIKPNESLKRRFHHKNARGEKGAALVFLQFGHTGFKFESKTAVGTKSYSLHDGRTWFRQMLKAMDSNIPFEEKEFPEEAYDLSADVSEDLDGLESGCRVTVQFGPGSRLDSLEDLLGSNPKAALNRAEHILRTRTAVGFIIPSDRKDALPECLKKLQVNLKITFADESEQSRTVSVGFHFPHLLAKVIGSPTALMTNEKRDSELLYDFITIEFLERYLPKFLDRGRNREIAEKYQVNGYFSYAYQNSYYEYMASQYLGLVTESIAQEEIPYQLVQINGGFQIAVKNYPNGRRHTFLHRSGAEDKSRTYVVLNFGGDYKPDYGRKNISAEVRPFVLDLCKELIGFATQRERKQYYKVGQAAASHSITSLREAREVRDKESEQQKEANVWLQSAESPEGFKRAPSWEDELAAEFCHYVLSGQLPGFVLYGLPRSLQYDAFFDYLLTRSPEVIYDAETRPLGIYFPDGRQHQERKGQWLEFKISSDMLVDDFKKREGDAGKKHFVLVDLLVCDRVDDATDDYTIVEVTDDEQVRDRSYYGVTHFLRSATDQSHIIQVICLQTLRTLLDTRPELFPPIERGE